MENEAILRLKSDDPTAGQLATLQVGGAIISVGAILNTIIQVNLICNEKQQGLTAFMRMVGMHEGAYWCSNGKMMRNMFDLLLEMLDFVLQMLDFVLKMSDFAVLAFSLTSAASGQFYTEMAPFFNRKSRF